MIAAQLVFHKEAYEVLHISPPDSQRSSPNLHQQLINFKLKVRPHIALVAVNHKLTSLYLHSLYSWIWFGLVSGVLPYSSIHLSHLSNANCVQGSEVEDRLHFLFRKKIRSSNSSVRFMSASCCFELLSTRFRCRPQSGITNCERIVDGLSRKFLSLSMTV